MIYETYKKGNKLLRIHIDENSDSPRECDNLGKMVCFHNHYNLGDSTELKADRFNGWEDLKNYLIKELNAVIVMPLFLYDHSGISIKVGSFNGLLPQGHAHFDSGQIGFIYVTKDDLKEEKLTKKKAEKILIAEVEIYNQYLTGNIYWFELIKVTKCKTCKVEHEKILDSCGGFYGSDFKENGLLENAGIKDFEKWESIEE